MLKTMSFKKVVLLTAIMIVSGCLVIASSALAIPRGDLFCMKKMNPGRLWRRRRRVNIEHPSASQAKRCGQFERSTSNVDLAQARRAGRSFF